MEHTIDATNQKIGRLATKVASLLMGKDKTDFARHTIPTSKVKVTNASKMDISIKKSKEKIYKRYSGYPGGLKEISLENLVAKKGNGEALKNAIYGMLPKNKLRDRMIVNLKITE